MRIEKRPGIKIEKGPVKRTIVRLPLRKAAGQSQTTNEKVRYIFTDEKNMEDHRDCYNKYILYSCIPRSLRNVRLIIIPKQDGNLGSIAITEPYRRILDKKTLNLINPLVPLQKHRTAFRRNRSVMHNVTVVQTLLQTLKSTAVVIIGHLKAYNTLCTN